MTLEEKVGQFVQYSAGQPTGSGTGRTDYNDMIAHGQIGALLNVIAPGEINAYQRTAVEKFRLHIPLLFGLDVIHGFKTEFPIPLGLASTWDPAIVEKASRVAAIEASANGIRWTFSPMVDIARDARWGRMAEGAGEDPFRPARNQYGSAGSGVEGLSAGCSRSRRNENREVRGEAASLRGLE
jgi:beta-glucosidase